MRDASPLLVGVVALGLGTVVTLAATNVIPSPDERFGAPRWIVALVGLLIVAGGLYALAVPLTTAGQQVALGTAVALMFLTVIALFFTWATLAAATGDGTLSVNGVRVPLPGPVERALNGALAGVLALVFDTAAVIAWWRTIAWVLSGGARR